MNDDNPQLEQVIDETSPISLPIEDADLIDIINDKIQKSTLHKKTKLKVDERSKTNEDFWLGKQIDTAQLDLRYQQDSPDNVVYQDLETKIALAAGRMPDIICTAPSDDEQARINAAELEDSLQYRMTSSFIKRLIKDGLRNHALDFSACIKCRWDENKGENGDFIFELVKADSFGTDYTATIPYDGFTADNCDFTYEWIEEPLAVVLSKFPSKREKLIAMLGGQKSMNSKRMATKIKYLECWFTWYGSDGKMMDGVAWKYGSLILDKRKNPYFDWQGYTKVEANLAGQYESKEYFYNHFERPRKPYIFFTYQNRGKSIYDDTTPVEQAIPIQKIVNKRSMQITELADRVAPRYSFNGSVMTKEEARRVDPKDPRESIWLDQAGPDTDIRKGMMVTQSAPPPPVLYNDLITLRGRIDSLFATHGTTRGEQKNTGESGISKQISREGDLTLADDVSDIIVERVVYEMTNWAVQMMKLNYKEVHFMRHSGKDGEKLHRELSRDKIDDGVVVEVKASSTDKQTRRADALQLVQAQSIDPLTLFEDLDVDNPKERARRLIAFQTGQVDGFQSYLAEIGVTEDVDESMTEEQAEEDLQTLLGGEDIEPKGVPTEQYVQVFADFLQNPQGDPEGVQRVQGYIQALREKVNQKVEQSNAPVPAQSAPAPQGAQ